MHKFYQILAVLALTLLLAGRAAAEPITLHTIDGQTVSGDMVSADDKGFVLKLSDGTYGDHVPWGRLVQADLQELRQNPKLKDLVDPFIDIVPSDKLKKIEIGPLKEPDRLQRPAGKSVIGAVFGSGMGLFLLFIVYAGNIYAGYEIALFRGKAPGLVCGVAAVAPVVGPIVFLTMSPKIEKQKPSDWGPSADAVAAAEAAAAQAAAEAAAAAGETPAAEAAAPAEPAKPVLPPTKKFARGQTTFNRRFVETQLARFAALVRPDDLKEMVLTVRAARGTYVALRVSNIGQTDMQLQVAHGAAFEDVTVPYLEIQEIEIKHKDA